MNGKEWTDAVLADYRTAPISEKLRATLGFLEKITKTPSEVVPADAEAVLATGVTRQGVKDALHVAAIFNMIVRLADSFGFEIPPEEAFEAGAKSLLKFGYKL